MAKPQAESAKIPRRPLAQKKEHAEKVIEQVLAESYQWPRPLIADFLKQLRNHA